MEVILYFEHSKHSSYRSTPQCSPSPESWEVHPFRLSTMYLTLAMNHDSAKSGERLGNWSVLSRGLRGRCGENLVRLRCRYTERAFWGRLFGEEYRTLIRGAWNRKCSVRNFLIGAGAALSHRNRNRCEPDARVRVIIETWSRKLRAKYFVSPTPKSCPKYCGGLTPNSGRHLLSLGAISGVRP